jgi:hypothetical protein
MSRHFSPRLPLVLPFVACIGLSVVACAAAPHWKQAGVSEADTARAWSDCQDFADRRVGYQPSDSALDAHDRRAAAKRYDQALDACMRGKGFFPTKGS